MTDTFSITAFRDFCRGKGDEGYDTFSLELCALGQFGFPDVADDEDLDRAGISFDVYEAVLSDPLTFSALAYRLDTLIEGGDHG